MSRKANDSGFSLVEALVALAVFAMAGVALVQLQTHSLQTFSRVETRALADLAAQNRLTEILASGVRPNVGARAEDIEFAGRSWRIRVSVVGVGQLMRVSVEVSPAGAAPAALAHGFFPAPERAP